ncbi:hypothetical protein P7K49_027940 [Saguinus oedipus]|uniref:Uncharacterized protein n=1 Tax=Saguinus oedipus TaxID=9490 RepID=A0ABQ9UAV0_SAGOE|nr:hypothetical protein P7K49_027940 [Saguinus oedipus]
MSDRILAPVENKHYTYRQRKLNNESHVIACKVAPPTQPGASSQPREVTVKPLALEDGQLLLPSWLCPQLQVQTSLLKLISKHAFLKSRVKQALKSELLDSHLHVIRNKRDTWHRPISGGPGPGRYGSVLLCIMSHYVREGSRPAHGGDLAEEDWTLVFEELPDSWKTQTNKTSCQQQITLDVVNKVNGTGPGKMSRSSTTLPRKKGQEISHDYLQHLLSEELCAESMCALRKDAAEKRSALTGRLIETDEDTLNTSNMCTRNINAAKQQRLIAACTSIQPGITFLIIRETWNRASHWFNEPKAECRSCT